MCPQDRVNFMITRYHDVPHPHVPHCVPSLSSVRLKLTEASQTRGIKGETTMKKYHPSNCSAHTYLYVYLTPGLLCTGFTLKTSQSCASTLNSAKMQQVKCHIILRGFRAVCHWQQLVMIDCTMTTDSESITMYSILMKTEITVRCSDCLGLNIVMLILM